NPTLPVFLGLYVSQKRRRADIPVCEFTVLSSTVFLDRLGTGKSPNPQTRMSALLVKDGLNTYSSSAMAPACVGPWWEDQDAPLTIPAGAAAANIVARRDR